MSTDHAIIWFDAIRATLNLRGPTPPRLTYRIRPDEKAGTVHLATEENLRDLEGLVEVVRDVRESTEHEQAIGLMQYFEAHRDPILESESHPAAYTIEIHVPALQFDELLAAAQIGRLPSLCVGVEGMNYTVPLYPPMIAWDNKALPQLKIDYIHFHLPLTPATDHDDSGPPLSAQLAQLSQRIDQLGLGITRKLIWLLWAVLGVLAVCGLILLRK